MEKIPIRTLTAARKEPAFSGNFSIRSIRDLLDGKDMVQELHRHDFFFILALEKGTGSHVIDFTSCEVGRRSVFFMRPGQVHQLTLKAGSTGYLVQFKADFYYTHDPAAGQILRKAGNRSLYQFDVNGFKKALAALTAVFREYTDKREGYEQVIRSHLGIFLIELVRLQGWRGPNGGNRYMQERLDELLELLEKHIVTHKQVSQYADMMNLSAYQLNAITKSTLGKTCSELINEQIILEAKRSLLATSNQVTQIAYQLGYEDVSYFIRFFRKHTGYPPDVFRNNSR